MTPRTTQRGFWDRHDGLASLLIFAAVVAVGGAMGTACYFLLGPLP